MRYFLYILCILIISCSPRVLVKSALTGKDYQEVRKEYKQKRKKKRAQKHIKKAIALDPSLLNKDTLRVRDTIVTENIEIDTVVNVFDVIGDTVIIEKDNVRTIITIQKDSLYITTTVKADTIYTEKLVPVDKLVYQEGRNCWLPIVLICLFFILLLYLRKKVW